MKQTDDLKSLVNFLKTQNIFLTDKQTAQLQTYHSELIHFADKHRIVSKKDIHHIVKRHFLSSFYFAKQIAAVTSRKDLILDLGSGAGFPGIILSVVLGNSLVMVDSIRKKTVFLNRISKLLDLDCEIINDRIENFSSKDTRTFQIITARALASLSDLIDLARPFLLHGKMHTIKGLDFKKENHGREQEISLTSHTIDKKWSDYSDYLKSKAYITFTLRQ